MADVDDGTGDEDVFRELHERWLRGRELVDLEQKVGRWKRGRWTPDELVLLKHNVDTFIQDNGVSDLDKFIFTRKRGGRRNFYRAIAKGIQRPIFTVYLKVIHLYNLRNYVGKWSRQQEEELLRLQSVYGNKWSVIGRALGVSGRAAQDKYRNLVHKENTGKWSEEEEVRLSSAVAKCGVESWGAIAEEVCTRNAAQCRQKWVNLLSWQESGGARQWDDCDNVQLLHLLSSLDAECEDDVDWGRLSKDWEAARSGSYLRTKWSALRRAVPRYQLNAYQDNLDYLMEHRLPALERAVQLKYKKDDNS